MASHELRTPLNSIIGFSEILRCELYGPLGDPRYKEYAGIIHGSGHRLLKLVNQILEVLRLEERAAELDPSPQRVESAVDDVLEMLAPEIAAAAASVKAPDRLQMPWVLADGRSLRTMLVNLIQNAIASSGEAPKITIRARRTGDIVEIKVQDRGEGIPLEDIPRLLRPFEQGEAALSVESRSIGLGVLIVRLLAEAMGGALHLDSRRGEGLTASIVLPAAEPVRRRSVAAPRRAP